MNKKQNYSEVDYGKSLMPSNRREQFKDILKNDLGTLFKISLICLISLIPFLACLFLKDLTIVSTIENNASVTSISNIYNLLMSLSLLIFFVCLSGITQIIKNIVYLNGVLFWRDFIKGIKENVGAYLKTGVTVSLLFYIMCFSKDSFPFIFDGDYYKVLLGILVGIVFGFILPILFVQLVQDSIYKLPYLKGLANSFRLTLRSYLFLLLFALLPLTLFLIKGIPNMMIIIYFLVIIVVIFLLPIYLLGIYEYIVSQLDRLINVKHYKTIYLKGLKDYGGNLK